MNATPANIAVEFPALPSTPRRATKGGGAGFREAEPFVPSGPMVFIPMRLGRRCGRKLVITPSAGVADDATPGEKNPLAQAVARAHAWRTMMDSGKWPSQRDFARHLGTERSYVSRIMRLTLLAPDIIEAILDGREPPGLSIDRLVHSDAPLDWPGQRRLFGFPAVG